MGAKRTRCCPLLYHSCPLRCAHRPTPTHLCHAASGRLPSMGYPTPAPLCCPPRLSLRACPLAHTLANTHPQCQAQQCPPRVGLRHPAWVQRAMQCSNLLAIVCMITRPYVCGRRAITWTDCTRLRISYVLCIMYFIFCTLDTI